MIYELDILTAMKHLQLIAKHFSKNISHKLLFSHTQVRRDREACMVMMVYLVVKDQTVSQETVDLQEMSVWMDSPVLGVYLVYKVTLVCQAKPCPPAS